MCADPISMGFMAASAGISAAGALSSGAAQSRAHSGSAAMYEAQAALRLQKAEYDMHQSELRFRRAEGTVVSRAASTGIDVRSFSDIMADDAAESALEREAIRWSAQNEANSLQYQADSQRRQSKDAQTASYFNAAAGVVNAFTPMVRGRMGAGGSGVSMVSPWTTTVVPIGPARDLAPIQYPSAQTGYM